MAVPEIDLHFEEPEVVADPVPLLRELQQTGPVVFNHGYPHGLLVTQFAPCQRVLGNVRHYKIDSSFFQDRFGHTVFEDDDTPRHDRIRAIWSPRFTRDSLDRFERSGFRTLVAGRVQTMVERMHAGCNVDVVAELTKALPELAIAPMFGIPEADYPGFVEHARAMTLWYVGEADPTPRGAELQERARAGTHGLMAMVEQNLRAREASSAKGDDLFSLMLQSTVAQAEMSLEEIIATCGMLVFAAGNSTSNLVASTIVMLAKHPDQRQLLLEDRGLIDGAIEEIARLASPVQAGIVRRVIHTDASIAGHPLAMGDALLPMLGIANRDPSRWGDPHRFDVRREHQAHLGFGFGMHSCLGMNFARMLIHELVEVLLDELPAWELVDLDYGSNFKSWGPRRAVLGGGPA